MTHRQTRDLFFGDREIPGRPSRLTGFDLFRSTGVMQKRLPLLLVFLWLSACAPTNEVVAPDTPWPHGAMVSAANPAAVDAALAVLADGGHAVDAAIAAHAVLGLVEPESSGLGGSAFMFVYDRASDSMVVFDGRETAPSGASPKMLAPDGERPAFRDLWSLGVTVGVPGTVAVYEAAHRRFGRTRWAELFEPAIRLATDGFEVTEKLTRYNEYIGPLLSSGAYPEAAAYLMPGGEPLAQGDILRNPAYADTLFRIANIGAGAFYEGATAAAIAERAGRPPAGSAMTAADVSRYRAVEREPVCGSFRAYTICSAPPPSSGVALISMPVLYDHLGGAEVVTMEEKLTAFVDAQRLAYADRDHFIADPDFVDVPSEALLDPAYLEQRARQRFAPSETPVHGNPPRMQDKTAWRHGMDTGARSYGTTHLSIIDAEGNAVSMTASVGFPFGSVRMTNGFFLNNELTDFSVQADGEPEPANAVAAGKRPRSSMSPTIVFDADDEPLLLTGSAGGSSILAYAAKTILGILDWNMTAQAAVDYPNVVARGESVGIEESADGGEQLADDLGDAGYSVTEGRGENSGLHVIVVRPGGLEGAADSRRHGSVGQLEASDVPATSGNAR